MNTIYQWFLERFLSSSKFWLAVAGVLTTFLADKFGLDAEQVMSILAAIIALILGKAIEDHGRNANPSNIAERGKGRGKGNKSGGGNPPPDKDEK